MPRNPNYADPADLGPGGRSLWRVVTEEHDLTPTQRVQLLEACRCKDRLDRLDAILRGDAETWMSIGEGRGLTEVYIDKAAAAAVGAQNMLKQLIAVLRLPDEHGKRPARPPVARGVHQPKGSGTARVSSLDRARAAKGG